MTSPSDFPNASPPIIEAAGTAAPPSGMAPAPGLITPVAGGPSIDPNYCPKCTSAGIGYCHCEIASNE